LLGNFPKQSIVLTDLRTGRRFVAHGEIDSCCYELTWVTPHVLVFDNVDFLVLALRPPSMHARLLAQASDFVVSPNGKWVAVWSSTPPDVAQTVAVVSIDGTTCLAVPRSSNENDTAAGFTADSRNVIVSRTTRGSSQQLVGLAISSLPRKRDCTSEPQ